MIHTSYNMEANITPVIYPLLEMPLFHILVEIPCDNCQNVLFMASCDYLQPILFLSFDDLHDFHFCAESQFYVLKNLFIVTSFKDNIHFFCARFGVF